MDKLHRYVELIWDHLDLIEHVPEVFYSGQHLNSKKEEWISMEELETETITWIKYKSKNVLDKGHLNMPMITEYS